MVFQSGAASESVNLLRTTYDGHIQPSAGYVVGGSYLAHSTPGAHSTKERSALLRTFSPLPSLQRGCKSDLHYQEGYRTALPAVAMNQPGSRRTRSLTCAKRNTMPRVVSPSWYESQRRPSFFENRAAGGSRSERYGYPPLSQTTQRSCHLIEAQRARSEGLTLEPIRSGLMDPVSLTDRLSSPGAQGCHCRSGLGHTAHGHTLRRVNDPWVLNDAEPSLTSHNPHFPKKSAAPISLSNARFVSAARNRSQSYASSHPLLVQERIGSHLLPCEEGGMGCVAQPEQASSQNFYPEVDRNPFECSVEPVEKVTAAAFEPYSLRTSKRQFKREEGICGDRGMTHSPGVIHPPREQDDISPRGLHTAFAKGQKSFYVLYQPTIYFNYSHGHPPPEGITEKISDTHGKEPSFFNILKHIAKVFSCV